MGNLHEDSEVIRWKRREDSKMARSERFEGSEVVSWGSWESSEATRWEVPGFIQEEGMQYESKISFFLFLMLVNETKEQDVFNNFLSCCMDGKTLFRFYISGKEMDF